MYSDYSNKQKINILYPTLFISYDNMRYVTNIVKVQYNISNIFLDIQVVLDTQ